jgi:hypothetical protein
MALFGPSLWEQCVDTCAKAGAIGVGLGLAAVAVGGAVELISAYSEGVELEKMAKKAARAQKKAARAQRYVAAAAGTGTGTGRRAHV